MSVAVLRIYWAVSFFYEENSTSAPRLLSFGNFANTIVDQ
jgi:hypothetical protein